MKPSDIIRKKVFPYATQENSSYSPSDLAGRYIMAIVDYLDEQANQSPKEI